jgi:hypothetical protein
MWPVNDPWKEHRDLHADDRAGIVHLYGTHAPRIATSSIFSVRQHFGDEEDILPGAWAGSAHDYVFDTRGIDVDEPAHLFFQARHVGNEHNVFTVNGQSIAGGVPVTSGDDGWAGQVMHISPRVLKPAGNLLRVEARNEDGGAGGDIDDFVLDNAVVLYSRIEPGLWVKAPTKWGMGLGLPGRVHEGVSPVNPQ